MKRFSLEEYLADPSKKVVTRDGKDVRILCTDARGLYPVVALVECTDDYDRAYTCTKDGELYLATTSDEDLFFAPKKKEGWVNVYKYETGGYSLGLICKDKKTAEASIHGNPMDLGDYVATAKIEWEEDL